MTDPRGKAAYRFLFDEHVNRPALEALRERGIDAVSVQEVGMAGAEDPAVFERARAEGRILVTRNYADFAALVEVAARQGISFPGVLFYSPSVGAADAGAHVRALEAWIEAAVAQGGAPAENTAAWLR